MKSICEYFCNIYNFPKDICNASFYLWISVLHFTHTDFLDKLSDSLKEN